MTTTTPTPSLALTDSPLSALAALLASGDPEIHEQLAAESLTLADNATSSELWMFWMTLGESFEAAAKRLSAPMSVVVPAERGSRRRRIARRLRWSR